MKHNFLTSNLKTMDINMSHFFCRICLSVYTAYFYNHHENKSQQMVIFCSCLEIFVCLTIVHTCLPSFKLIVYRCVLWICNRLFKALHAFIKYCSGLCGVSLLSVWCHVCCHWTKLYDSYAEWCESEIDWLC